MKLSVIVVAYNMRRELPRTLQSLQSSYQIAATSLEYEVLVVDNGSPEPFSVSEIESHGPQFRYFHLENPPPSPAFALNFGASKARGEILCFMVDGAHMLTPGVFSNSLACFRVFSNPIVGIRYFFLGPGHQNDTIFCGYDQSEEDRLLESISWPEDGYRLFEIGSPLFIFEKGVNWFNKMIESNCLFMLKRTYDEIGGSNEQFDFPGGGFMNIDLYQRAANHPSTQLALLVGEGSFHQVHGGETTNVSPQERDAQVDAYKQQYRSIYSEDLKATEKETYFFGHLPTEASKIHRRKKFIPPLLKKA